MEPIWNSHNNKQLFCLGICTLCVIFNLNRFIVSMCFFLYIYKYISVSLSLWFFFKLQYSFFNKCFRFQELYSLFKSQQITLKTKWLSQWLSVIHSLTHSQKLKKIHQHTISYVRLTCDQYLVTTLSKCFSQTLSIMFHF